MTDAAVIGPDDLSPGWPAAPQTVEETGLAEEMVLDHVLRVISRRGLRTPSDVARVIRLPVVCCADAFERLRAQTMIAPLGALGADIRAEMRYELTDRGAVRAAEAFGRLDWVGAAPVPLDDWRARVAATSVKMQRIRRPELTAAFRKLVVRQELLDRLGPAVNSGQSMLLYGPPGTGKSSIASALARAMGGEVWVPHAVAVSSEIIQLFDPVVHHSLQDADEAEEDLRDLDAPDPRYVRCRRPVVTAGSELMIEMLDLRATQSMGVNQAPLQMKAAGGVIIIDDLGRQRETPQAFLNRLIVPLEEGIDYLALASGLTFEAPYDVLTIFSTNIPPAELVDGAGLRRIYYKILVDRPNKEEFVRIFLRVCSAYGVEADEEMVAFVLNDLFGRSGVRFAGYQAPYLIDQAVAACDYNGLPRALRREYLQMAWDNLNVVDGV